MWQSRHFCGCHILDLVGEAAKLDRTIELSSALIGKMMPQSFSKNSFGLNKIRKFPSFMYGHLSCFELYLKCF